MLSREDGLHFDMLGKEPTVLYICLSDDDESNGVLQAILLRQLIQKLNLCAIDNGGCLPVHVELLIDELCNMPPIQNLASQLTISRSRGMRFTLVCQGYDQLIARYGDTGVTIANNCANWVLLYVAKDYNLLDKASRLAGRNEFGDALVDPSALALMPMGQALVFSEHKRPYMTLLDDLSDVLARAVRTPKKETEEAA
jgi:type IV secretory pathway TraG/TraD family ATPase VirD4